MNRGIRLAGVATLGLAAAISSAAFGVGSQVVDVVVLGAALVAGYMVELRPAKRSALPVAFAIVVVLLRAASPSQFVATIGIGCALAVALRDEPRGLSSRALLFAEYLAAGLGAGAAYRLIMDAATGSDARAGVLGALAVAAIVEIVVADLVVLVRDREIASWRERGADVALVTSGMLMAVGYGGIAGGGRLGLWGPLLFSIPLIAVWYSFELLQRTRRTLEQTVQALGVAPELGGLVRPGHVERVADLSASIGRELGVGEGELEDLETAAWLHHFGVVCLDEPEDGEQPDPAEVARAGAEMLWSSDALASAGDVVAAEPRLHRPPGPSSPQPAALLGQILKVASAYDELTEGDDAHVSWAVEALFTGPAYVYDGRVLAALERVLSRRGLLVR